MSSSQLDLRYADNDRYAEAWAEILDEIRTIAAAIGLKTVAFDLNVQPSILSHALQPPDSRDEDNRHRFRGEWLPYFIARAPSDRLVALLARLRGLEIQPRRELSPAEKLDRLLTALERNPSVERAILAEAGITRGQP